jgi:lipopolysaccharide/colanic/teichoic acid biosynthesis glycosyltransferase
MPELTTLEIKQNNSFAETDSKPVYTVIKRIFDFISSLCVSVVLLIPMIIIAIIIMIKDYGNPIYAQNRMGRNGKILKVYKFRSMKKGADNLEKMLTPEQLEEYRKEYKLSDDPRLIGYKKPGDGSKCFGAGIRRTSLDELVQILINICILGNMSVIGPRPILKEELEDNYTPEQQKILLSVKPGLTGYWQAYGRNNVCYEDGKRQEMELYYVKNRSLTLDVKILFKTVEAVLKGSGAK